MQRAFRRDHRRHCARGRAGESARGAESCGDREERPDGSWLGRRVPDEQPGADQLADDREQRYPPPVESIGHCAGHEDENYRGQELGEAE